MLISKSKSTNYGFSANAIRNLNHSEKCKYYVYGLIDPDQDNPIPGFEEPFYIGKGCGNRVFNHIRQASKLLSKRAQIMQDLQTIPIEQLKGESKIAESDKIQKIWEIFDNGKEPKCVIYRWGMTEQEAFEVEATLIDCMPNLTNIQCGHDSEHGMTTPKELENVLNQSEYEEPKDSNGRKIPYIIIKLNGNIRQRGDLSIAGNLYNAVRGNWSNSLRHASHYHYVLAVVGGVVREVYEVDNWHTSEEKPRIAFDGKPTTNPIMRDLVGKLIPEKLRQQGVQGPLLYCNGSKDYLYRNESKIVF